MKQLIYRNPGDVVLEDAPIPEPGPKQVLVKILGTNTSLINSEFLIPKSCIKALLFLGYIPTTNGSIVTEKQYYGFFQPV